MAGRRGAMVLVLGVCAVSVSCGGRSHDAGGEDGDDTGGAAGASGGDGASGGNAGTASGAVAGVSSGGVPTGGVTSRGGTSGVSTGGDAGASRGGDGAVAGRGGGAGRPSYPTCNADSGGAGPGGARPAPSSIVLVPDETGWIDRASNSLCIQGAWYPFGDQYPGPDEEKCLTIGLHEPAECSVIVSPPPPPALGFPQETPGTMCTSGEVAVILPCPVGLMTSGCPAYDYANMSGAGIGVDFGADRGEDGGARHPWNPVDYGIVGFSFEIDTVPLASLRVEIPIVLTDEEVANASLPSGSTSEQHPDGSPYWGATATYPASPVAPGVNRVLWTDIRPPRTNYLFDPSRMLGIQFHVPAVAAGPKSPYGFCIQNLTLLRQ